MMDSPKVETPNSKITQLPGTNGAPRRSFEYLVEFDCGTRFNCSYSVLIAIHRKNHVYGRNKNCQLKSATTLSVAAIIVVISI